MVEKATENNKPAIIFSVDFKQVFDRTNVFQRHKHITGRKNTKMTNKCFHRYIDKCRNENASRRLGHDRYQLYWRKIAEEPNLIIESTTKLHGFRMHNSRDPVLFDSAILIMDTEDNL